MGRLSNLTKGFSDVVGLRERLAEMEEEIQECRQVNLRLAELCDVMMELLLPVADRDDEQIQAILTRYRADVSDPLRWRSGPETSD
jgi:uncharacterized protein DUF6752